MQKFGVMTQPSGLYCGYRRVKAVEAANEIEAIRAVMPWVFLRDRVFGDPEGVGPVPRKLSPDAQGTPKRPIRYSASDICAVPFDRWVEETRRRTGDPDAEPLEDYTQIRRMSNNDKKELIL